MSPIYSDQQVAHYDFNGDTEVPLRCIIQGSTQNNNKTVPVAEQSATTQYLQSTKSATKSIQNERVDAPRSLSQHQLESRRARDRNKYASKTPEQKQARHDRQRSRRQSMTAEQKRETNTCRVARQNLSDVDIFDMNARRRSRRQNVTPGERTTHLARRNARYAARRDKPCVESIAMECPKGCNPSLLNRATCLQTIGDVPATSTLQLEQAVDHPADHAPWMMIIDSFMEDNTDDEYYMFIGLGDDEDVEMVEFDDEDTQAPTSSFPDLFDYVYNNIPQSTNELNTEPDHKHYGAKRFQYEPSGFYCRGGNIRFL